MAQLVKRNGKVVSCNILNENANTYIIELNGKVGQVKKDRIVAMNAIDEAVLADLAKKFADKVKGLVGKIKEFFVSCFYDGKHIDMFDEDGKEIYAHSPANMALSNSNAHYAILPDNVLNYLENKLGVNCSYIRKHMNSLPPVESVMQKPDDVADTNESFIYEATARDRAKDLPAIKNVASGMGTKGKAAPADIYIKDITRDKLCDLVISEYIALYRGKAHTPNVICVWGAPGLGKTAFSKTVLDTLRSIGFTGVQQRGISCLSTDADKVFYMPAKIVDKRYLGKDAQGNKMYHEEEKWDSRPVASLPAFSTSTLYTKKQWELADMVANGYMVDEDTEEVVNRPDGGLLFFDEFSRINPQIMTEAMTLFSDRTLQSGAIQLGSRWVIILSGNRKSDMEGLEIADLFKTDAAQFSRIKNYNLCFDPDEWLDWVQAKEEPFASDLAGRGNLPAYLDEHPYDSHEFKKDDDRALPEIIDFLKTHKALINSAQVPEDDGDEFMNQFTKKAIPRSWIAASSDLENLIYRMSLSDQRINSISTLMKYCKRWDMDSVEDLLAANVGRPAAETFIEYYKNRLFSHDEAVKVWQTGKCKVKSCDSASTLKDVTLPVLINTNPNITPSIAKQISDGSFKPTYTEVKQILPCDQLINVTQFISDLSKTCGGTGTATEVGGSTFKSMMRIFFTKVCGAYSIGDNPNKTSLLQFIDSESKKFNDPYYLPFIKVYNDLCTENSQELDKKS
jgi:hypothetical protein